MMFDGSVGHGLFGGGFMWLFWILLIVIMIYIFKGFGGRQTRDDPDAKKEGLENALEILRRRYAEGEIDEAEFERRKKELQKE